MKAKNFLFISVILFTVACNRQTPVASEPEKIILRFEVDTLGNITDPKVREQVIALAQKLQATADKMMISAYTEQSGSVEQNEQTAKIMVRAVRELMKTQGERNATNVGIDIKGFQNPIDSVNPANIINRRIEITPL